MNVVDVSQELVVDELGRDPSDNGGDDENQKGGKAPFHRLWYGKVVSPDILQKPQVRKQGRGKDCTVIHLLQPIQRVCPCGLQPIAILASEEDGRGGGEEGEDPGGGALNQVEIGESGLEGRSPREWESGR